MSNIKIHFLDKIKTTEIKGYAEWLKTNLVIDSTLIVGTLDMGMDMAGLTFKKKEGSFLKNSRIEGQFGFDLKSNYLKVVSSNLKINDENFQATANMDLSKNNISEIKIINEQTDLSKALPLLPEKIRKELSPYKINYPFYSSAVIKGYFRPNEPPVVIVDFNLKENEITAQKFVFKNVSMVGRFSNRIYGDDRMWNEGKKRFKIIANNLNAHHDGFKLKTKYVLITSTPATGPLLKTHLKIKGRSSGISKWLENDQFLFKKGRFELNANIDGPLNNYKQLVIESDAELKLNDFSAIYLPAESEFIFDHLYLNKKLGDADFSITSSQMKEGLDFRIEGSLKNLPALLLKLKERASSDVVFVANKLSWTDFIDLFGESGYLKNKEPKTDAAKKKSMKETIRGIQYNFQPRLSIAIDTLQYFDLLELHNFKTGVHFENEHTVILENTSFNYEEGDINFKCRMDISSPEQTPFEFVLQTNKLNLKKLLPPFKYFKLKLLSDIENHPENVSIEIKHKGILNDQNGLIPNTSTGEIIFKINEGNILLGKIIYTADSTKNIYDKTAAHTKIALEGMPFVFNEFFRNDQFFFDKGRFFVQFDYYGQVANFEDLLNKADATFLMDHSEVYYKTTDVTFPLTEIKLDIKKDNADFDFFIRSEELNQELKCVGQLENLSELVIGKTGKPIKTKVDIVSPKLIWQQFIDFFVPEKDSTTEKEAQTVDALKATVKGLLSTFNPDLQVNTDTFIFSDKLTLEKVVTGIGLSDTAKLVLNETGFNFHDGSVGVNGVFDLGVKDQAPFSANFSTDDLDVVELLKSLDYLDLPSLKNIKELSGDVTMNLHLSGIIADDAKGLIMDANDGVLDFTLNNITIKGFEPLDQIAKKIKQKKRFMELMFAPISNQLIIKGNDIEIPLMEIQSNAVNLFVEGVLSYGDNTDIWVSIPLANLKSADRSIVPKKRGYAATRRKIYVQVTTGENGENKFKIRTSKRKFYKQRGILSEYKRGKRKRGG